jgi:hypothetical protein
VANMYSAPHPPPVNICRMDALPVASLTVTSGVGKVTPVRYEYGQQDGSGQEEKVIHL